MRSFQQISSFPETESHASWTSAVGCNVCAPLSCDSRFDARLRLAAEDVLFFCDCVKASTRVVLCDAPGAVRGEGINIFHSIDNDSPKFLKQQFNTWVALDLLEGRFAQRSSEARSIRSYKTTARRQALWSQARRVRRRKLPQFDLLAKWVWRDPVLLRSVFELAAGKLAR